MITISTSGHITYNELHEDIERLVSMKAGLYVIPGYDREDVGQEIRMTCAKALNRYDPDKNNSTAFHFLARCVDNRLKNLLRDNASTLAKNKKDDNKAVARVEKKKKLQGALSVGSDIDENQLGEYSSPFYFTEFHETIEKRLPKEIKASFSLLINNGPPAIPKSHLKIIKDTIREVYPSFGV